MVRHLTREEVVTIQVLKRRGLSHRRIASQLGVTEGEVRYRIEREREGRPDGRSGKPRVASEMVSQIEAWLEEYRRDDRPTYARRPPVSTTWSEADRHEAAAAIHSNTILS